MKQITSVLTMLFLIVSPFASFAQTSSELVFKNPVLVSAPNTDKKLGAVYRFYNVTTNTDALLTIASASQEQQLVNNIDVTEHGWDKAFQPEIGKDGDVAKNQDWWVRFNLKFVYPNTTAKKKLDKFYATAMDVDGDNYVIQEYIQMYKPDSIKYRTSTLLTQKSPFNAGMSCTSKDILSQGPITNYTNIDTAGYQVMVTYTFMNTDEINFVYGAKVGNGTSNAGLRLNSLWFKSFNLNSNAPLPLINNSYILTYDKKNVRMEWKSETVDQIGDYTIERSTDNENFRPIGEVKAVDGVWYYNYTDANVSSSTGVLYYRIMYREKTGEVKYSSIKLVKLNKETTSTVTVYPNPVQSMANLTLPYAWQNKPVIISVYNAAGNLVKNISIKTASQTETLDFQQLSRGIYVVKAQCENQSTEQRILRN